ncbi:MAG: ribose-phosphate pyrophosphokinase [Bacilli bacterium]|nr:ribose-phosphate pyrophosphokinase [Bacilli bacterium]
MLDRLKIVSLTANPEMAKEIAKIIGKKILPSEITHFADGEILFTGKESFRGDNVYIVQSTCTPVTERLMELLLCIDACKRASARTINCIIPYFGYSRQDRKAKPRQPISAKLVADMIEVAGAHRIVATDLHASQIAGFFNIPVDDVSAMSLFYKYFVSKGLTENIVCVSPDHGGLVRTSKLATALNAPIAVIDKRRPEPNKAEILSIVGDVKDKTCIIVDDIVDTAGTLLLAVNKLKELGATKVYAAVTHGVLSLDAVSRINESHLDKLIITDSIPLTPEKKSDKIEVLSLAPLFAKIIVALEEGKSLYDTHQEFLAELFEKDE